MLNIGSPQLKIHTVCGQLGATHVPTEHADQHAKQIGWAKVGLGSVGMALRLHAVTSEQAALVNTANFHFMVRVCEADASELRS
jgi:hypothetical protein